MTISSYIAIVLYVLGLEVCGTLFLAIISTSHRNNSWADFNSASPKLAKFVFYLFVATWPVWSLVAIVGPALRKKRDAKA